MRKNNKVEGMIFKVLYLLKIMIIKYLEKIDVSFDRFILIYFE